MKNNLHSQMKGSIFRYAMVHLPLMLLLITMSIGRVKAQCYSQPAYCTPSVTNVASYGIGMSRVTLTSGSGASINNTTGYPPSATPVYFNWSGDSTLNAAAGATITGSIVNGTGNTTTARIYIDYNRDGTFGTTAPELVWSSATSTAGATVAVSFNVPVGTAPGVYRIRVTGDIGGSAASPCALGFGEVEDYSLVVTSGTADALSFSNPLPVSFFVGNNTVAIKMMNLTNTTMTSVNIGYKLGTNSPVTESRTGLSIPAGGVYTTSFSTQLNIPAAGNYTVKTFINNINGAGTQTAANDTVCRSFFACAGSFSGIYTIDPAGSGSTNFTSFGAAISQLALCGVSGPVTFNVAAATYNEQVSIPSIPGASATNSIAFNGGTGNAATRIITFNATSSAANYTVDLNGANFIRFKNITITATNASFGTAVRYTNNASSDSFYCVTLNGISTTSTSTNLAVVSSGSSVTVSNFIVFDTCTINNGSMGFYHNSSSTNSFGATSQRFSVNNCTLNNQYYAGIYSQNCDGVVHRNNRISTNSAYTSYYGIYNYWVMVLADANKPIITGNRITGAIGGYGIYNNYLAVNSSVTAARRPIIANNMITIGTSSNLAYGIYESSTYGADYYHNSVNIGSSNTTGNAAGMYFINATTGSVNIQNNIFASYNGSPCIRIDNTTYLGTLNNNVYYTSGSSVALFSTSGYTLSGWKTLTGKDAATLFTNPGFVSNTDLHVTQICNNGANLSALVSTDFDGQSRPSSPDVGADESSSSSADDAGIFSITAPTLPISLGSNTVKAIVKNHGTNALSSITVSYVYNGGTPVSQSFTLSPTLNQCDTQTITFSTPITVAGGTNTLKVYTSLGGDGNTGNDTVTTSVCAALSGAYTIDPAGSGSSNFASFNAASNALVCGGVSGAVTFNVAAGTYNEQVTLFSVPNASSSSNITFQSASGIPSSVNLTYNANSSLNYTLGFSGSNFFKFRNMTMSAQNSTYGVVVQLTGGSSTDSFYNVTFNGISTTSTGTNLAIVSSPNGTQNANYFDTCRFNNGSYGAYFQSNGSAPSSARNSFNNCTFTNQYYSGLFFSNVDGFRATNNRISTTSSYTGYNGIYAYWILCSQDANRTIVSGNRITGAIGGNGIYSQYVGVNSTITQNRRAQFVNNMISIGSGSNSAVGIYDQYSNNADFFHNTVVNLGTTVSTAIVAGSFLGASYGGTAVVNNIFSSPNGAAALNMPSNSWYPRFNYNDIFSSGATLGYYGGIGYGTLSAWKTSSQRDTNSVNIRPVFVSSTDLHISNKSCMNDKGTPALYWAATDIDGESRNATTPDVGADEFSSSGTDLAVLGIRAPLSGTGLQNLVLAIQNNGATTITSFNARYILNANTPVTINWTGTLNACDTVQITFSGANQINIPSGLNQVKAFVDSPNGIAPDNNSLNDTAYITYCSGGISGNYTIDGSIPASSTNFQSFTSAVSTLSTCGGLNGAVSFSVAAGTYTGQIDLTGITGLSASNTLTFDGGNGNAATRIVTASGTASNYATVRIRNLNYITFRNLTISGTSSNAWPVHIVGTSSVAPVTGVTIKNCNIDFGTTSTSSFNSANYMGIVLSGSTTSYATSGYFNSCTLDSNNINGGYYGISIYNPTTFSSTYGAFNAFTGNTITNAYNSGLYLYYLNGGTIDRNTVSTLSIAGGGIASSIGIQLVNGSAVAATNTWSVQRNKIFNVGQMGININNTFAFGTARGLMANNLIGGGFYNSSNVYGIYATGGSSSNWNLYNNTINIDNAPSGTSAALYLGQCCNYNVTTNFEVKNNILAVTNASASNTYCYYMSNGYLYTIANTGGAMNYNMLYKAGTAANYGYDGGTNLSATSFISYNGLNSNSMAQNPFFNSANDLRINYTIAAFPRQSTVTADYLGTSRGVNTDPGAYETPTPNNEVSITGITVPSAPYAAGNYGITATLYNNGANTVTSATVSYSVDGTFIGSTNWTGSIAPGASTSVNIAATSTYSTGAIYALKVYSSQPNGSADAWTGNDTFSTTTSPAMCGAYTINQGAAASGTNFVSFNTATTQLMASGVSCPVTFTVMGATPYSEQVEITAFPGSSATNTVTFDGGAGNAASRIITFGASSAANRHTFRLTNVSNVIIQNLTIRGTGTNAWPMQLTGSTACNRDTVRNCIISFGSTPITSFNSTNYIGIVASGSTSGYTTAGSFGNCAFDSNAVQGGYIGIDLYATNNASNAGNRIAGNTITNTYQYGTYVVNANAGFYDRNVVSMNPTGTTGSIGMYFSSVNAIASTDNFSISRNKITYAGQYGIYLSNVSGNSTTRANLLNNVIGGGFTNTNPSGLYLNSTCNNWNIYHNTVNMDNAATGSSSAAFNFSQCCTTGSQANDVRNNIMAITNSASTTMCFYMSNGYSYATIGTSNFNYNLFYKAGSNSSTVLGYNGGNNIARSAIIGDGGYNANSVYANPFFTSSIDLTVGNASNDVPRIASVTTDYNGTSRGTLTDIGAYETASPSNDVGITAITAPAVPIAPGSQNVTVTLKNFGANTLTSANVTYVVNGGSPVTVAWSGTLASGASTSVTFSGANQYNFVTGSPANFVVYTSSPNGVSDAFMNNDTFTNSLAPTLCGTNYTINSGAAASTTNFTSFTSAVNYLNVAGVSCPVYFTVAAGTYTEQVELISVVGASATNTITFDGWPSGAASTILTNPNTTSSAMHTFRINNTPGVTLRNLTIRGTNASFGWPVHILGNSSNFTKVKNCLINFTGGNGATSTNSNYIGVVINNSTTTYTGSQSYANNIEIDSNTITGGYIGISMYSGLYGNGTGTYRNNTITNAYQYGISNYYFSSYTITGNNISMRTGNTSSAGMYIYFSYSGSNPTIAYNYITNAGQYGIYNYYGFSNGSGSPGRMYNNMIGGGFSNTNACGIYTYYNQYWNIDYNTVNVDVALTTVATSSCALYVDAALTGPTNVRNNIFATTSASNSTSNYVAYIGNVAGISSMANNNYFNATAATNILYYNATNYTTATLTTQNAGNKNINPSFPSATNLKMTITTIKPGVTTTGISDDIDGRPRSASTPYMGAYEVPVNNDLTATALLSPSLPTVAGTFDLRIRFRNIGANAVTSGTGSVGYILNGGSAITSTNGVTLNPLDTSSVLFTGGNQITINPGSSNTLKIFASGPSDGNKTNDTLTLSICPGLNGTYTIDTTQANSATNFKSFSRAVAALNGCGGVAGPVTFNVSANTYVDQISIGTINGSSSTNTVTFNGAGMGSTILTFNTNSTNPHVVRFNGTRFVTFRNMSIQSSTATDGWIVNFLNSSQCKIANCNLNFTNTSAQTSAGSNLANVVVNGNATSMITTTSTSDSVFIDSCTMTFGYYNVVCALNNNLTWPTIWVRNDSMANAYSTAFYDVTTFSNFTLKFLNNRVSLRSGVSNQYGIHMKSNSNPPTGKYHQINGNRFNSLNGYGLVFWFGLGNATNAGEVYNNIFGGNTRGATQLIAPNVNVSSPSVNYTNIYHNTFITDFGTGTSYGIHFNSSAATSTSCNVRNNVFYNTSSATQNIAIATPNGAGVITALDYNNFYTNHSSGVLASTSGSITTSNFRASYPTGLGLNCMNTQMSFTGANDFHHSTGCLLGQTGLGITTDFDGVTRSTPPSVGAYEPSGIPANDASAYLLSAPVFPVSAGTQPIKVVVRNNGSTAISSLSVSYVLNGASPVTESFTFGTALNQCDTATVTFATQGTINAGNNTLKVYTSLPSDANTGNDTLNQTICVTLSGTYTIDPAGSGATNFTSFTAANNALSCGGINGNVTFNVAAGTYNEQMIISAIPGSNSTRKVTFQSASGVPSSVNLTFNATSTNYTVMLNGASNVAFRNMTITAQSATLGTAVLFNNGASNDSFYNVIFNSPVTTSTSTNNAVVYMPSSGVLNYNYFDTCTFNNGSYGVYLTSSSSNTFGNSSQLNGANNSNFTNQYAGGWYTQYADGVKLTYNRITTNSASTGYNGIYNYWIMVLADQNRTSIIGNTITGAQGGNGIYNYYLGVNSSVTAARRYQVFNNMISIGAGSNTAVGLYDNMGNGVDYYHNTAVNRSSAVSATNLASYFAGTSYGSNNVVNNIFHGSNGAAAIRIDNNTYYPTVNYNNLYTTGTNFAYYNGTQYTTMAAWRTISARDANSVAILPVYVSASDLHISNKGCLDNLGTPSSSVVATDIDKASRNATTPDIGADEFSALTYDSRMSTLLSPSSTSIAPGTPYTVQVRFINQGNTAISNIQMNYDLNGTVTSQTFTPGTPVAPCDSATFTFSSSVVFTSGTSTLKIYSGLINGSNSDQDNTNDTITNTYCAPYTGTLRVIPTVTPNNTDTFATLSALINRVYNCGIGGPVTVEIADGQYNENMTFNGLITGSSPVNTLTFRPAAGDTGVWVNGTATANVIDLNGADYITFDGRAGGTGSSRIFNVYSTNSGMSAVRLINDAKCDTFRYVNVYGNNTSSGVGNFYIGTSTGTDGNDSNTVEFSQFNSSSSLPVQQIAGVGTVGKQNDYFTIRNNNILNYFVALNANNAGIFTNGNNRNWTISNNNITQTGIRTHGLTGTTGMHGIYVFSNTDINFNITGNTIGGNIPGITGSVFQVGDSTLPSGQINQLFAIRNIGVTTLAAGTTYITGNTVRNLRVFTNFTAGVNSTLSAVLVNASNVEIGGDGVSSGNNLGDINNIRSLEVVNMATGGGARLAVIRVINGCQNLKIKNNQIGGAAVRTPNNSSVTTNEIIGIQQFMTGANTTCFIDSNTIQNLENVSGSNGSGTVAGIWASANNTTHNHFIRMNTVNGLYNYSTSANALNNTWGIMTNFGQNGSGTASTASFKIDSNVVSNLSTASTSASTLNGASVIGIGMGTVSTQASPEIINNRIFNISGSGANTTMYGLYYANTGANGLVSRNRIYNLTNSSTGGSTTNISGMTLGAVNNTTIANNQITIVQNGSSNATIGGISDATSANTVNYHYNTVYVGGNQTGSATNAGVFTRTTAGATMNLRNNIFYNGHLSSGNNFMITIPSAWGTTTSQYNYFVGADTTNAFRVTGTSTTYGFTPWKAAISDATGSTANTAAMVPAASFFADVTNGDLAVVSNYCEIHNKGVVVATTNDFANATRSAVPDIGSRELDALYDLGVSSIASPVTQSGMTSAMAVKVYVKNYGTSAITNTVSVPVRYSINNGNVVNELITINPTLNAGDSILYTFAGAANMAASGTYNLKAWVAACDASAANDTAYKTVQHTDSVRVINGDFISATCPSISGTAWIDLKDSANNLIASINPNGNNLGATCYGIRIYGGSGLRVDTAMTGDVGFFLDRNVFIEPTNQPTSPVSVRLYMQTREIQEVVDSTFNRFGQVITGDSIKINKYHGPRMDLDPYNNDTAMLEYEVITPTLNVWNSTNNFSFYEFNVNSFSELNPAVVPGNPSTPLPVSWLSFTAEKNGNNASLKWSTATEFNSDRFEIERSTDGVNFTTIGKVNAAGMSPTTRSYQYTDVNADQVAPVVFYRITEYDNSEKSSATDVKYVSFNAVTSGVVNAWPNPANDVLNISVPVDQEVSAGITIVDMTGKVVDAKSLKLNKGLNVRNIALDGLSKGIYMVQVNINGKVENLRIVKH